MQWSCSLDTSSGPNSMMLVTSYSRSWRTGAALLLLALGLLSGCSQGKRPFLMVQFCLADQADLVVLKQELKSIAQAEGMDFIDGSEAAKQGLEDTNAPESMRQDLVILMSVEGRDGISLMLGNMGLPSYQVAMGFSEGSDPPKASAFADAVLKKLGQRWHLRTVPAGTGARALNTCN